MTKEMSQYLESYILKRVSITDNLDYAIAYRDGFTACWEMMQGELTALETKLSEKDETLLWAKKGIERLTQEKSVLLSYLFDIDPAVDLEKVFRIELEREG